MKKIIGTGFPKYGLSSKEVIQKMKAAKNRDSKWRDGKSFCLIYYPGDEKAQMIREAYNLFFEENALNPMSFPSLRKFETEVVAMVADLLHGDNQTTGTMTSGGTESILMALKSARDYAREKKPEIKNPEIILPVTAHPAFDKACHYFDLKAVHVPVDKDYKADLKAIKKSINSNTIMIVGSAPSYPHGLLDPISELSKIAIEKNIWLHVDACIGGLFLPFAKKAGYIVPDFDFALEGVSSMSADLHKFGYTAKGASVILYKNAALRKHQFFVSTNWPGGIYGSPSMSGSKPGGAIAAAWAALVGIGENGYVEMAKSAMKTTEKIRRGIENIPGLKIMGEPDMCILAFESDTINMYELADELNLQGWHFERLQNPPALHLTINYIHEKSADQFLEDLKTAVGKAKKFKLKNIGAKVKVAAIKRLIKILPEGTLGRIQAQFSGKAMKTVRTAPMYGMMGALSGSEDLNEIVLDLLDKLNRAE